MRTTEPAPDGRAEPPEEPAADETEVESADEEAEEAADETGEVGDEDEAGDGEAEEAGDEAAEEASGEGRSPGKAAAARRRMRDRDERPGRAARLLRVASPLVTAFVRLRRLTARLGGLRLPLAVALALAIAAGTLLLMADGRRDSSPAVNRALVDNEATTKVSGDISNALTKVFSYSYADLATTERAAGEVLEGRAAEDYRKLFAKVRQEAPKQRLAVRTRVVRAGVTGLSGDTAHVLAFLDQVTTRDKKPAGSTAAAQLSVTARLRDGQWRISDIRSS